MPLHSSIRKIYFGVADRRQMFRLFDRHAQRPNRFEGNSDHLYAGEYFEIGRVEHDYMLDVLSPLWMRGEMFAMREFLTETVTSVFYTLRIDGKVRYFHAYCDLTDTRSPVEMRDAIVERESWPVKAISHEERLEHIWSATHDEYRGYAGERWLPEHYGKRTVLFYGRRGGTKLKLLEALTEDEIQAKLPVHLRYLLERHAGQITSVGKVGTGNAADFVTVPYLNTNPAFKSSITTMIKGERKRRSREFSTHIRPTSCRSVVELVRGLL
ncbi:DUF1419 domain-containing protein [Pseudaminobacter arsenicus]|uniref:DUF1419 domain-containing protein n=1 Tax=Borborobacter arsenicus TaxID=1851146 RepID=A0A432V2H2_9HYPH|nr:DUF1419 domain-containing protein [Pseudaminobacter arsenicus]